jgi:excisionase family DNA binding protein
MADSQFEKGMMKTLQEQTQTHTTLEIMTLAEAAVYLRVSKSTLYQRKDIPRHRMPGSREVRFFKNELMAWLRNGEVSGIETATNASVFPLDSAHGPVYHRNPKYRG